MFLQNSEEGETSPVHRTLFVLHRFTLPMAFYPREGALLGLSLETKRGVATQLPVLGYLTMSTWSRKDCIRINVGYSNHNDIPEMEAFQRR